MSNRKDRLALLLGTQTQFFDSAVKFLYFLLIHISKVSEVVRQQISTIHPEEDEEL